MSPQFKHLRQIFMINSPILFLGQFNLFWLLKKSNNKTNFQNQIDSGATKYI